MPSAVLPATIKPMLARLTHQPFDSPDHIFELKWDGFRVIAFVENGTLRLQSRNLRDITTTFSELSELPELLKPDNTIVDGEVVCFDKEGKPSFSLLQKRLREEPFRSKAGIPDVSYIVFDVLYADGKDLTSEPLMNRKALLRDSLEPSDLIVECEFIENDGAAFFGATAQYGLEGIVAKEKTSLYFPGKRSPDWHKVKGIRECDFVIGGYDFVGGRKELFSSLMLGLYDINNRLVYVGNVGTGFNDDQKAEILLRLGGSLIDESPFDTPHDSQRLSYWCDPTLVARVQYGEFTVNGRVRYPVFLHLRDDKFPADCKIVDAPGWPKALPIG